MAIGARAGDVLAMIVGRGVALAAIGAGVAVVLGIVVSRNMRAVGVAAA